MYRTCLVVLLASVLAAPCSLAVETTGGPGDGRQLLQDIELLRRIVPLHLTDQQIDQLLEAYGVSDAEAEQLNAATVEQLTLIKSKLLRGESLSKEDETILRGISRAAVKGQKGGAGAQDVAQRIAEVLTPEQVALLQAPRPLAVAMTDKARRQAAARAIGQLAKFAGMPEAQWPAARDSTADRLVAAIENPEERQATRENVIQFLERLRGMGAEQVQANQHDLAVELQALVPGDSIPYLWQPLAARPGAGKGKGARAITPAQARAVAVFLSPQMPRLLLEMKASRGAP